jgi:predicted transcriptional regulator
MRRHAPQRDVPPPLELECLKTLWNIGEGTVRDVREEMSMDRNLAYTTVMTVLGRLKKRGGVSRRKQGRSFVYSPTLTREELQRFAV